jgi:LPXTG-motif cell wall-anchored protein
MEGFRFVALGYAFLVLLIAPTWLSADEVPPSVPAPTVEAPAGAVQEAVPELPTGQSPAPQQAVEEPEVKLAPEREVKRDAEAEPAKADGEKKRQQTRDSEEPVATTAASASVTIRDFEFAPATVTINEGDTITWTNEGPTVHTATANDGSFDTGSLRKGESGSATFTSAGTIAYICTPHPNMEGTVVVQAASAGSDGGSGSGGSSDTGSTDDGAVAGDDAAPTDSGSGLPTTGMEALAIALLGLATLGLGLLLRRRREEA